ncbi:hypothetical protein [Deinococcus sedimenti]|uniref:Lipoprotein n=1 Tax=Deinococcus sedimenti TaxID=1867090 RepID=A0ABQ2S1C8_9DEIO|nr:hypothetical protein [Deinococcus sedimenti]GGR88599.1 hypothetical protein GCM10008960_14540 [Deinococcus sedimenti]
MRRHGAAALLTLALTACTGGGGGGPTPTPQAPATPQYTGTVLDTLSVPAGCVLDSNSEISSWHPAGFQPDGRGGALLGLRCRAADGQEYLRTVYRLNAAGVQVAAEAPADMTGYGVNGAGLYFMGSQLDFGPVPYVTAQGERFLTPYLYEPDIVNGFLSNRASLNRVDEDGTVHGSHRYRKLNDDAPSEDRGGYSWTWRPGQERRQVRAFEYKSTSASHPYVDVVPGQPGSGEEIAFMPHGNTVALRGLLVRADGSFETLPTKSIKERELSVERWTPGGYVVTYANELNGALVYSGYFLWHGGVRSDRVGVLEHVAADGDAVVSVNNRTLLRRPGGEEYELPRVDRDVSASELQYVAAGGGIAYAVAGTRVYRYAAPNLSPSGTLTLSGVTPADQLAADPLPGAGARATRRADGSHLSVKLSAPVAGHQRTLFLTLHGSLAAGQTFTLGGASGAQVTGATFTDIRTSPVKVNTLFARSGTVTLDGWTGGSAKLTLRNVVLGGNAGQSVTLSGTLTLPEVELE